ncbi:MAG TPA: hypothetical protein PLL09_08115 [Flavobacterium sp.]|uniref:hypothetical protein n=1 Tax=unclassified Flavobacterium TaxID=196869 RepID=UPI000E95627F|nr:MULTISPECIES: hypothetical protein [unclassified Flavobacterium]HBI00103.1 hypothetical protein [Flavobacterium sp.]HRE77774.1 hypothetical protein [Flavobacterium sp.]
MTLLQKIQHLESYLHQSNESYSDTFKADILLYFNEDFTEENPQFEFLKELQSKEAIEQKVDFLLSQFVIKFDSEQETEDDFIHYYLAQ